MGDDGLLQRFQITVWPDPPKHWKNIDRWPDTEAKRIAYQVFRKFDDLQVPYRSEENEIPALRFSSEGQEIFNDWRHELEMRLRAGGLSSSLESHLAKYRSLMPSLALIFHLVSCKTDVWPLPPIDKDAALMAVGWCQYLETHAKRLYSSALDPAMESARALLQKIKNGEIQDYFSPRDIYRKGWSHLASSESVYQAIKILIDFGWLRENEGSKSNEVTTIRIHPDLKRDGVSSQD